MLRYDKLVHSIVISESYRYKEVITHPNYSYKKLLLSLLQLGMGENLPGEYWKRPWNSNLMDGLEMFEIFEL